MDLSEIHFHDCEIRRVVELPEADELLFEIFYPTDWENNMFEPRTLAFVDVLNYEVHEGPFSGAPTILDVVVQEHGAPRSLLRVETNAGYRSLRCGSVELRPSQLA